MIAAGSGKLNVAGRRVPLDVKPGDQILFGKYTSQEVKLDGEEYLIMRDPTKVVRSALQNAATSLLRRRPEACRQLTLGSVFPCANRIFCDCDLVVGQPIVV